ncbi:MAG: acyl-CoA thioesterase [Ruminococcaceae bacterium]|nr:acyl-CoA thioesterase [Oscillospiraceae bacterium]
MDATQKRRVADSEIENVFPLIYKHMNSHGRLFGGVLMQWIDQLAGMVAYRHAHQRVITAVVDSLAFKGPAFIDEVVVMHGCVTYVGRTSIEVKVDTFVETIGVERRQINEAYLVMVAIDEKGEPCPVPGLELETEEQKHEWAMGEKRNALRKQRRLEQY